MGDAQIVPPIMYRDMVSVAEAELSYSGIEAEQASTVARKIMPTFCQEHGGKICRVPLLQCITKPERDKTIRAYGKTMTLNQLARKYELSYEAARGLWGMSDVFRGVNC